MIKRLLHPFLVALALLLLLEEWLWERSKRLVVQLAHLLHLQRLERLLRALPPWASLLALALPALTLFPFKLLSLYWLSHGHFVLGVGALVSAKLVGTALVAYVFDLVRDNARRLGWFDRLYVRVVQGLDRVRAWLAALPAVIAARAMAADIRTRLLAKLRSGSPDSPGSAGLRKWRAARRWASRKR